ncbi:MAG: S8 family serine peptidase [Methylococcaceae bacterium]
MLDSAGRLVEAGFDTAPAAVGNDDALVFRPVTTGIYYLAVSDVANINTGSWELTQNSLDTIAGNISTTERIDWGGANTFSVSSEINALSDHDWFRIWLDKGITYDLRARVASGAGTLADPQLTLRSVTGILLTQDDNSGGSTDARITYSATDSGWYYLDAGASGNAGKGTYQLQGSMLADDYSNDRATTGLIQTAGTAVQGLVSYNGDSDWFRVGLSRGHTYVIDLTGDVSDTAPLDPLIDPLLIVHDADGDVLFKADDFAGSLNARAYFTPTTDGLYYLEAKSAFKYDIGAYQLRVSQAPADDFADTLAEASSLTLGTAQNGTIGVPGDRDLFKLELTAGRVYQVGVAGLSGHVGTLADTYLRVFDSAGHLIDFDNNGGAGNDAQLYLAPASNGTYYLETSASKDRGMGTYQISVAQHDLPPDDVPNDLSSNVSLTPGDSFVGNLLTHNDQDWFRIILEASKNSVFRVQASSSGQGSLVDPVLEIRAGDGTLVQAADNTLISNDPATSFVPATNGSYYLVVKAANGQTDTGSYTLVTRAPDDYSNTLPGATTLTVDTPLTGAIQWADGAYGVRAIDSTGLATDSDEDWFKFTASLNQVLSVNVSVAQESALSRPMVEVVDGAGHSLAVGDGLETLNGLAVATFKAAAAGTYYARVIDGAGATGAYQVSLAAGDASDEDTAGAVALNFVSSGAVTKAETQARIGLSGDSDQFSVTLQSGHSYRIETLPMRDGIHAPLASASLQLAWQAQGAASAETVAVIHDVATPSFFDTSDFTAALSGTMRITVQPLETTHTGQYKLRVVDLGTQQDDDRPDRVNEYVDATDGVLAINENRAGSLDSTADTDLYAVNLSTGNIYDFSLKGYVDGLGTLAQGGLRLLDSNGQLVTSGHYDRVSGRTDLSVSVFSAGRYYLAVTAENLPGNTGTYLLDTRLGGSNNSVPASDITADTRSGVTINLGQPVSGRVDYAGDHDWMHASLTAGKVYVIDALANGNGAGGSLQDASLRLLDVDGNELAQDDNSGAGLDARIQFTPDHTGDYYLDVGGNNDTTGSYTLRLRELYSGTADPLKAAQWYLPAIGLDVLKGQMTGAGVKVGVVDDGIDTSHPDLQHQLDFSQNYDTQFDTADGSPKYPILIGPPDNHGTLVAGIIAAEANNETGIVGVAPDAELVSTRVKWSWDQITQALDLQSHFDVSNNSWGAISPFSDNFNNTNLTFAYQALRKGVEDGRSGQGTVFVFAAGNSAGSGDNTNYHNFQSAREVIAVGAAQSDHNMAGFSTPGATVLVSTYGADMITTDRHQAGWGENPAGNYTSFSGTSAAAPMVSGVVALMLEANPGLGYRDIQKILAYSATHPVEQDWKINAAFDCNLGGLAYNDQAGFGLVDAYAAVCLADTWQESNTALNEVSDSARAFGLNQAIPDGNEVGWTRSFTIDNAMRVEHLELGVDLRHTRLGDLIIEITSPQGTVSRVLDRPTVNAEQPFGLSGTDSGMPTHLLWDFASTQFWGEEAVGQWAVTIRDVRAEETGTLSSLSLRVYGEREDGNDTYVFTEEGFQSQATRELTDESGTDTLNASPLLHDLWVDLQSGGQIAAEGVSYPIAAWTSIENAIAGSGNDRLQGNDLANKLEGRDGADTLTGGLGNDTLDGGNGSDTARYAGNRDEFAVSFDAASKTVTVRDNRSTGGDEGIDTLKNIERLVFNDAEMSLGTLSGNHAPVANTSFFSTPVQVATTTGLDFVLPARAFSDADSTDISKNSPPVIQVSAAAGGDLPGWLSFDAATHKFTGVPPADLRGRINVQVRAVDDFGDSASDTLTLQFGDNQAPVLDDPSEKIILEDAGRVALNITAPHDPEGKTVSVRVLEVPTQGIVLDGAGNTISVNAVLTADGLSQLHYQTTADVNGDMGYLRYQVTDADNVTADSSVHLFIDAINDAPRFANNGSGLVIQYPAQSTVTLEMLAPSDPESTLSSVKITELPALGVVKLNNTTVRLDDSLTLEQLSQLTFTLSENVNGPIGAVTIEARDPQGLATRWSLALQVQGAAASSVGTTGADSLYGSIGADTLQGMAGDDLLEGNAGDDRLLGGLGNDSLFGGSGADTLDGSSGNDYLDGGTGNDIMLGGPGNDTYVVDSSSDVVMEVISSGAGGKDLISTSVTLTAPANIEMLQAVAGYAIDLTGQSLNNTLVGNDAANNLSGSAGRDTVLGGGGNDTLDGGTGVDRMAGGTGDDLYRVDSRSDSIVELTGEGTDTVRANTSYTLTSNIENLILEGTDNYTAGGNSLDNRLVGNSGNNILAGGLGSDTLEGGAGNDIYVLNDSHDTLIDTAGNDTIRSSLDVVLPEGIENAELVGLADTTATGNAANNLLVGNMGDNILEGAGGADTLTGGDGSDQFLVSYNGLGVVPDTITDFMAGIDLLILDISSLNLPPEQLAQFSSGTVDSGSWVKGAGATAIDQNDYFLLDTATGVLKLDVDGTGAAIPLPLVSFVGHVDTNFSGIDIYLGI